MITKEYLCPNGHLVEHRESINDNTQEIPCDRCDDMATRVLSVPKTLITGFTPTFHKSTSRSVSDSMPIDLGDITP